MAHGYGEEQVADLQQICMAFCIKAYVTSTNLAMHLFQVEDMMKLTPLETQMMLQSCKSPMTILGCVIQITEPNRIVHEDSTAQYSQP